MKRTLSSKSKKNQPVFYNQDVQDKIFRKMSAEKKIQLVSEFSTFLLKLNQLNKRNGIRRIINKDSQHLGKA